MGYRRDGRKRRTTRLLTASVLTISPVFHGCTQEAVTSNPAPPAYDGDVPDEWISSNPKGSLYDEGLVDADLDQGPSDADVGVLDADLDGPIDEWLHSNPKGSLYDEGLIDAAYTDDGAGGTGGDGAVDLDAGPEAGTDDGAGGAGGGG